MTPMRLAAACLAALAIPTQAVFATDHQIIFTGMAFFPAVTYAQPGDTIVIYNDDRSTNTFVGKDDTWVMGPVNADGMAAIGLDAATTLDFYVAHSGGSGSGSAYGSYGAATIVGSISYDPPPLDPYLD